MSFELYVAQGAVLMGLIGLTGAALALCGLADLAGNAAGYMREKRRRYKAETEYRMRAMCSSAGLDQKIALTPDDDHARYVKSEARKAQLKARA